MESCVMINICRVCPSADSLAAPQPYVMKFRKVAENGIIPYVAIPLQIANIACSRTPNLRYLPSGELAWKSIEPFHLVLLLGVKSALPPIICGRDAARCVRILPPNFLLASGLASAIASFQSSISHPDGRVPFIR